ncbi:hypothetical protein TNCT_672381 [Trichonephila clavata]|uniref:Uncharacterized protein n=1 Tax=Trichonephila clavata TaxID=2740835 RepID=A0A8X6G9B4_TRICU|nr:hypothetical protein TNCT_672381 [Trichonephila clavata]
MPLTTRSSEKSRPSVPSESHTAPTAKIFFFKKRHLKVFDFRSHHILFRKTSANYTNLRRSAKPYIPRPNPDSPSLVKEKESKTGVEGNPLILLSDVLAMIPICYHRLLQHLLTDLTANIHQATGCSDHQLMLPRFGRFRLTPCRTFSDLTNR